MNDQILFSSVSVFFLAENYDYLRRLLSELCSSEDRAASIQGWDIGGKVYLDYIHMMQTLEQLKQVSTHPSAERIIMCMAKN